MRAVRRLSRALFPSRRESVKNEHAVAPLDNGATTTTTMTTAETAGALQEDREEDDEEEEIEVVIGDVKVEEEVGRLLLFSLVTGNDRDEIAYELGGDYDCADLVIGIAAKYYEIMAPNAEMLVNDLPSASRAICGKQRFAAVSPHYYITKMVRMLNEIYDRHDPSRTGLKCTGIQILIIATIYIDRMLQTRKDFILHPLNLHRVLFGGVIAAIKFTEDVIPDQKLMSFIGGLTPIQTKQCENCFCELIQFRFWLDSDSLQHQFDNFCLPFLYIRHFVSTD